MSKRNRTHLALGVLLILASVALLVMKFIPTFASMFQFTLNWPAWIIIGGCCFLLLGLILGEPELAIPACIFAGVGGILYYQLSKNDFTSWTFFWTLIPGFAGVGNILSGIIGGNLKKMMAEGFRLILISAILFVLLSSIFGRNQIWGNNTEFALAGFLLLAGLWLIIRGLIRSSKVQ